MPCCIENPFTIDTIYYLKTKCNKCCSYLKQKTATKITLPCEGKLIEEDWLQPYFNYEAFPNLTSSVPLC